jgi:hypothetical protein
MFSTVRVLKFKIKVKSEERIVKRTKRKSHTIVRLFFLVETVGIEGQAPRICFANYPNYMSLVLRQGEPHEMDYRFDPCSITKMEILMKCSDIPSMTE